MLSMRPTTAAQTRKEDKGNAVAMKIIKQGVSSNLYINTIGERGPHGLWETLRKICSRVGQGFLYKELLNYSRVINPLGCKEKANSIFAEVK